MRRPIAIGLASLALVASVVAPAAAGSPNADARARAEHDRVVTYWTAERIANARPRDLERLPNGHIQIKAKPPKPGGGTVTGASWAGGGDVVKRTGKVLFTMGGGDWVCSGAVINDARTGYSQVFSAAHCLYDEAADEFATNWLFIPSFDTAPTFTCTQTTIGCWTARALIVHSGWANEESLTEAATMHDFGVAVVAGGGRTDTSLQLDSAVGGAYAVNTNGISVGTSVHAFGYPAAGRYKGKDLTYCAGPTFLDQYNDDKTFGIACNMTGGSSGGPWMTGVGTNGGGGTIVSLNSYGYGGLSNMYGPRLNSATAAVLTRANSTTGTVSGAPQGVIVP